MLNVHVSAQQKPTFVSCKFFINESTDAHIDLKWIRNENNEEEQNAWRLDDADLVGDIERVVVRSQSHVGLLRVVRRDERVHLNVAAFNRLLIFSAE